MYSHAFIALPFVVTKLYTETEIPDPGHAGLTCLNPPFKVSADTQPQDFVQHGLSDTKKTKHMQRNN